MKNRNTQQFAKFYIKDLKVKIHKDENRKNNFEEINFYHIN